MEIHVSSKGQIVIPAELRRKYAIKAGTKVEIFDDGEQIILRPVTPEYIRSLRGSLKGGDALKVLTEERRKERE
jgi:AbrB family looped-hinge helix DNA binding protein